MVRAASKIWLLMALGMGMLADGQASAAIHHTGCDQPVTGIEVCWDEVRNDTNLQIPFQYLYLLPISQPRGDEREILVEYTQGVYRQLFSGEVATGVTQQWNGVATLDQAVAMATDLGAPTVWIAPRILRNSGSATPGLVDWDLYLIDGAGGHLISTMRLRVSAAPQRQGSALNTTIAEFLTGGPKVGVYPLELLTEYAVRKFMELMINPYDPTTSEAPVPASANSGSPARQNDAFAYQMVNPNSNE